MNDSVGSNTGDGQEITDLSSILASNRKKLSKQSRGGANSQEPQEVSVHLEFMCLLHLANERVCYCLLYLSLYYDYFIFYDFLVNNHFLFYIR